MGVIAVRPAHNSDTAELAGVLGRAFAEDPVMTWIVPAQADRTRALPRLFTTMASRHFLAGRGVEVASRDGATGAAALWDPPNRKPSAAEELLMLPGYVWALRARALVGRTVAETMKRMHPEEPHWYLAVIGSDPTVRGGGFGQALMRSRLDRVDEEHAPAYLESSNPDNVPYYQRFGFEVTGEIVIPGGGPTMWPMWRQPR